MQAMWPGAVMWTRREAILKVLRKHDNSAKPMRIYSARLWLEKSAVSCDCTWWSQTTSLFFFMLVICASYYSVLNKSTLTYNTVSSLNTCEHFMICEKKKKKKLVIVGMIVSPVCEGVGVVKSILTGRLWGVPCLLPNDCWK